MITIEEYVRWKQGLEEVVHVISLAIVKKKITPKMPGVGEIDKLMRQTPRPGRGGLLRGEKW